MGRGAGLGEQVRHHHVEGSGRDLLEHGAGVSDADPHPSRPAAALVQGQPLPDQVHQRGIPLDGELAGPGPGRRHVPGQGQAAAAEVQHAQRLPGRGGQVDQVTEPPHVLELQVLRVIEVDVGLRGAVQQQRPGAGPVGVGHELGHAGVDLDA